MTLPRTITVRNVNYALSEALWWLRTTGILRDSRNGRVLRAPAPVLTMYTHPTERVLFSALRDANPFFHHMEALWMLGGRRDVEFPASYAKQIAAYSDDGVTLHGAYGHRWRAHFCTDQLLRIIELLRTEPTTRRAVLAMWDAASDPGMAANGGRDVPCNTHAYFEVDDGVLNMTVCCRSNDAIWGAYGANAVHFSMLQQFVAEAAGYGVGWYAQLSNNLHVYVDRPDVRRLIDEVPANTACAAARIHYVVDDQYSAEHVAPRKFIAVELGEDYRMFLDDVDLFLDGSGGLTNTKYFRDVVLPMQAAHCAHRSGDVAGALRYADKIAAADWRLACVEWLHRRAEKKGGAA